MLRQGLDDLKIIGIAPIPAAYGAAGQADMGVADHSVRVKELADPQAITLRASPVRVVEAEHPGLELLEADAALRAAEPLREEPLPALQFHLDEPLGELDGALDILQYPLAVVWLQVNRN